MRARNEGGGAAAGRRGRVDSRLLHSANGLIMCDIRAREAIALAARIVFRLPRRPAAAPRRKVAFARARALPGDYGDTLIFNNCAIGFIRFRRRGIMAFLPEPWRKCGCN